jgi:hypothetical protein
LERQAFVADKKAHFDMMIDIAEEEYKIDIRKLSTRTIDHFKHKEQQTIMFACNLFDRQTGLLSKN